MFLLGVVAVQQFSRLPDTFEMIGLVSVGLLFLTKRCWWLMALAAGLCWASLFGSWRLAQSLPDVYQNADVKLQGYIASLPQQQEHRLSFDFVVTEPANDFPEKLRLSWYYPDQHLAAGQSWELTAKLRKPHARQNPGGFDYEAWLFANRISATGNIRSKPPPRRMDDAPNIARYFASWRQAIADRLDAALPASQQVGVIKAFP